MSKAPRKQASEAARAAKVAGATKVAMTDVLKSAQQHFGIKRFRPGPA